MTLIEDDLRSDVLRCSTKRPGLLTDADLLGETKVHLEQRERRLFFFAFLVTGNIEDTKVLMFWTPLDFPSRANS